MKVIKLLGLRDITFNPPEYVVAYDPDLEDPDSLRTGFVMTDTNPSRAMLFRDFEEALLFVKQVSHTRPVRPDGKPNRPITAYHLEICDA